MTDITGTCRDCAAEVRRERATGQWAEFVNGLPLVCPACSEAEERRELEEQRRDDELRAAEKHRRRLEASGLPSPLQRRGLADLDQAHRGNVLAAAARWAAGDLSGLLLTGGVGVGKTTIAAAAVVDRTRREAVAWIAAHQLIRDLQGPFDSTERRRAQELIDGRRASGAIVVDDLDKVRPSEFAAEAVFALIDTCEAHGRGLLITTNLRPAELAQKWPAPYGEAIGSRLRGTCAAFALAGQDRRVTA